MYQNQWPNAQLILNGGKCIKYNNTKKRYIYMNGWMNEGREIVRVG